MEKNLFELNEKLDTIINEIQDLENLVPHPVWKTMAAKEEIYNPEDLRQFQYSEYG